MGGVGTIAWFTKRRQHFSVLQNATTTEMRTHVTVQAELVGAYAVMTTIYDLLTKYSWMSSIIIGVPGNIISIMITSKKANRHISSCNYMTALAVADTMTLLSVTWALTLMHWGFSDSIALDDRELLFQWIWYVIYLFAILSGLFLAEMSVDRLLAVRFPMVAVNYCTTSRAWKTIIFTAILITVLNANLFYTYRYSRDKLGYDILRASVPDSPVIEALALGFQLGFGTLIPFVIIVFSNLWIIITVHKANKETEAMAATGSKVTKKRDKDAKYLTRMLILVCIAYVACSIPYRMYDVLMNLPALKEIYDMEDTYWILRYGVEYWCIIDVWYQNYAINFYLYCMGGGRKYRNDVKAVFRDMLEICGCMQPAPTPTTSTVSMRTKRMAATSTATG